MPRRVFECFYEGCVYKTNHSRNFLRHLEGRTHRADESVLAQARAYVKRNGIIPSRVKSRDPPYVSPRVKSPDPPSIPPRVAKNDAFTQTTAPCCADCYDELVAVRIDNSEYRDFFPTPDLMIAAVEKLDAYEALFNTPADLKEYLKRIAPERMPAPCQG